MDVSVLYNQLANQPDRLILILESLGFTKISYNSYKNTIRFAREEYRNPSSCMLDCSSLRFFVFSTNKSGNIFTMIMDKLKCSFPKALEFAASKAGIIDLIIDVKIKYPFGGFYKKLSSHQQTNSSIKSYPETILERYSNRYSKMFFDDGIDYLTQQYFEIGYDISSERITIPERSISGDLIGIMGRSNDPNCDHEKRWLPIIPCSRNQTLFGYVNNYHRISETRRVVLYESEKAVMQSRSFGCHIALAVCGCRISDAQIKYIQLLHPTKIIIAFDEGLEEENIRCEAKKLVINNNILKTKVGYIWDEGDVIPIGSKMNLADLGKDAYQYSMTQKIKWIN